MKLRAGQSLRIVARLAGGVSGVVPVLRIGEGDDSRETRMEPEADGFALALDGVDQGFRYSVTAAGTTSRSNRTSRSLGRPTSSSSRARASSCS